MSINSPGPLSCPRPTTLGHLPTSQSPITPKLQFFNSVMEEGKQIPTYRVLDGSGQVIEGAELPEVRCYNFLSAR